MGKMKMLGLDGLFTFALSNFIVTLTLGVSLLPAFIKVVRTAAYSSSRESDCEYLFVFGLKLLNNEITEGYIGRLRRAYDIFLVNPQLRISILGGTTPGNTVSEAMKGKEWLIQQGVPEEYIETEDQSLNTLENLKNARSLLMHRDSKVCFITNRYHLCRVSRLAHGMSLAHTLCAAEDEWELSVPTLRQICIEAYYIHWYEVGRVWAYMTANKKSIRRISS